MSRTPLSDVTDASDASDATALDIVFFGSYDTALHPRVEVLRDGLRAHGHRVEEINEPLGLSTADKVHAAGSIRGTAHLLRNVLSSWRGLVRRGRRHPHPDLVVVGYLGHLDVVLARVLWPSSRIALDHLVGLADTAVDRGVARGPKLRLLQLIDRSALARADIVIVDTVEQMDQLSSTARSHAVVVPVGATDDWFAQEPAAGAGPIKVCFVGLFTPLHGAPVIGEAISLLSGDDRIEFTMIGTGQDLDATRRAAGSAAVEWIDWVDSTDLPGVVAAHHVGLGIFGTTPKALRVVPTKVYQSLAVGNTVITSDTPAQRRMLGDLVEYVPPGDAQALADRLLSVVEAATESTTVGTKGAEGTEGADGTQGTRSRPDGADRFRAASVVAPLLDRVGALTRSRSLAAGPALPPNAWLRFDLLRTALEQLPRGRVLEFGPGGGAVAARMVAAGHEYTGVEMSDAARERTRSLLDEVPGGRFRLLESTASLDATEQFDAVYAFEVLEHIEDDRAALSEWVGHLRPGGQFLLSVPAFQERFSSHDREVGHFRRYEPDQLRQLADAVGLTDVRVRVYGFPLGYLLETGRHLVATWIQRGRPVESESAGDRTQRSGMWMQPPASANRWVQVATWPFRLVQRPVPTMGTGLVLIARAPD